MHIGRLSTLALACLVFGVAVADDCHSPKGGGGIAALASDVCRINSALGASPPDYVTAKAVYSRRLQGIATSTRNTPSWRLCVEHFGSETWMDDILLDAFNGDSPFTTDTKRVQGIKKILQGTLLSKEMLHHVESAKQSAKDGKAKEALASMERAMGAFYGEDVDCAPFGNGQARGIEFNTMKDGVSRTNYNIAKQFHKGAELLTGDLDVEGFCKVVDEIKRNVIIIYIQSVAKYASLIDQAIEGGKSFEKAQGEGFGYLHAILAVISNVNAGDASKIVDVFNPANKPTEKEAEEVLSLLKSMYGAVNVNESEVKSFDGSRARRFVPPKEVQCAAVNPFAGRVEVTTVDADK